MRRDGALVRVSAGHETIDVDFGDGPTPAVAIPWGDVFTAHVTTGIPNIAVYTAVPPLTRALLRATRWLGPVLATAAVQRRRGTRARDDHGPSAGARLAGRSRLWGGARDAEGRVVTSVLVAPRAYELTRR